MWKPNRTSCSQSERMKLHVHIDTIPGWKDISNDPRAAATAACQPGEGQRSPTDHLSPDRTRTNISWLKEKKSSLYKQDGRQTEVSRTKTPGTTRPETRRWAGTDRTKMEETRACRSAEAVQHGGGGVMMRACSSGDPLVSGWTRISSGNFIQTGSATEP